jgi:hypothetical protein
MAALRRTLRPGATLSHSEAHDALRNARTIREARAWLESNRAHLAGALGPAFGGSDTDWPALAVRLQVVRSIRTWLGEREPPAALGALLLTGHGLETLRHLSAELHHRLGDHDSAWSELQRLVRVEGLMIGPSVAAEASIDEVRRWLHSLGNGLAPFWAAAAALLSCRRNGPTDADTLLADAREAAALVTLDQALAAEFPALERAFGPLFAGISTDWTAVARALDWTAELKRHFAGPLPETFISALEAGRRSAPGDRERLTALAAEVERLLGSLEGMFEPSAFIGAGNLASTPLDEMAAWATSKRDALPRLEEWVDVVQARATAESTGLGAFVETVVR